MKRNNLALLAFAFAAGSTWASDATNSNATIEEVVVQAPAERRTIELIDTNGIAADTAQLLKRAVGADVVSNGPITGMAQVRGMSRFRVASHVDGASISPGGPNWMDAPLTYAPAATLERLSIHRGIAPVSAAAESIGGVVSAESWQGEFTDTPELSGRVRTGYQSASAAQLASAMAVYSADAHKLRVGAMYETADDVEFDGGTLEPSEYERNRYDLGYGFRAGDHEVSLSYARVETGDAGTAALPMDIQYIDADLWNVVYRYAPGHRENVKLQIYGSEIDHGMTNYHLRTAPPPPMWRRNITAGDNIGARLTVSLGGWRVGADLHRESHESDIGNPNNAMFFVQNFDDAERSIMGLFAERVWAFDGGSTLETGLRVNRVKSNADLVNATPAVMGMPPAVALRDNFNTADRSRTDTLVDIALRLRVPLTEHLAIYAGAARKSRAPAYQERFLWLPLQATAGLADGRTYTGNLDLDPEIATDVELGFDWRGENFVVSPRFFYRNVDDYITGAPSTNAAAIMFTRMMGNAEPLAFTNVDARFYGVDVDWHWQIADRWRLHGLVDLVRAERRSGSDDLYRIPPASGLLALTHDRARWSFTAELMGSARQDRVAVLNNEPETAGYAVINVSAAWRLSEALRLNAGVENLADRRYRDHLAGIYRPASNADLARGERIPGAGRNVYLRLDLRW